MPGLVVDLGTYAGRWPHGAWSRAPAAVWRCRYGCIRHAAGAPAVLQLLAYLADLEADPHDPVRHAPRTT